jgi:hypothetical protein
MNVLLIGSGKSSQELLYRRLDGLVVCAINNAWTIPCSLDYSIFPGDWIPANGRSPEAAGVSYKQYQSKEQREKYGSLHDSGLGATMFFNSVYWILENLKPKNLGMIGCSMYYPDNKAHTFYGGGNPDPMRFSEKTLFKWFDRFYDVSARQGCVIANLGSNQGFMTYPSTSFQKWMDSI